MRLLKDFALVTVLGTFVSSLYLISSQFSKDWSIKHDRRSLSPWYLLDSFIDSFFGFAVNVIFPYVITELVSKRVGFILLIYCFGFDEIFRMPWYFCHLYFHKHQQAQNIYLMVWASVNQLNTYIIVPIAAYMYYFGYKHRGERIHKDFTEHLHQQHEPHNQLLEHPQHLDVSDSNDQLHPQPLESTASDHSYHRHFYKFVACYCFAAVWYTVQFAYQYYHRNEHWSPFLSIPPFIIIAIFMIYEKYVCHYHKQAFFRHFIFVCIFVLCQELLFDWQIFTGELEKWTLDWDKNAVKIVVFMSYTVYFKIISFVAGLLTEHVSFHYPSPKKRISDLRFIFIVYYDVYITLFISLSNTIDWTIMFMVVTKVFSKFITFNQRVRSCIPYLSHQTSNKKITTHFVHSLLSSLIVYIGQIVLTLIDYQLNTEETGWILSPIAAEKTEHNLFMSIAVLALSFVVECLAFSLVYYIAKHSPNVPAIIIVSAIHSAHCQQHGVSPQTSTALRQNQEDDEMDIDNTEDDERSTSVASSFYNIYGFCHDIEIPLLYFVCVVAYSQIASLNIVQFFPFVF